MLPRWSALLVLGCSAPPEPVDVRPPTDDDPVTVGAVPVLPRLPSVLVRSDDDPPAPPPDLEVRLGDVVTCADPAARHERRFDVVELPAEPLAVPHLRLAGGGVTMADLDGDGDLDLFLPGLDRHDVFERDVDGAWRATTDVRLAPGLDLSLATAATPGDVDLDGDLDLVVVRWGRPPVLLRQEGGVFVDGTADAGLDGDARAVTAALGDPDGDGDLDLFVGGYGPAPEVPVDYSKLPPGDPARLWENQGDGTFVDVTDRLPDAARHGYVFLATWQDLDDDLRPELLIVRDFGSVRPNTLLWNRPEGLVADDGSAGLHRAFDGMGVGLGDLDGDLRVDFAITSVAASSLLVSTGGLRWYEVAAARNFRPQWWEASHPDAARQRFGWGVELVDLDLDADLDLPVVFGSWSDLDLQRQRDAVFELGPDGRYDDLGGDWGFDDRGIGRGLAVGDLNEDGWPDLVVRRLGDTTRVHLSRCGGAAWLRVRLQGPGAGQGIGARVEVRTPAHTQVRWVRAGGSSLFAASAADAAFGLADAAVVDVVVHWPDGEVTELQDVGTRRVVDVIRRR